MALLTHLFLIAASLLVAFVAFVSYPTWPTTTPWQAAFDVALVTLIVGLACAWRLAVGRSPLVHAAWYLGAALGAAAGGFGAAVALWHLAHPHAASELVGFVLLAPGALLAPPLVVLLWRRKRKAVRGYPRTARDAATR